MSVLVVVTVFSFVLPGVFARHAARTLYNYLGTTPEQRVLTKEEIEALFRKPDGARAIRYAYRWALAAGVFKFLRWPLLVAVLWLALV